MSTLKKSIRVLVLFLVFIGMGVSVPGFIQAGALEPSNPPGSTMKTLDEIPPTWSQTLPASDRFELVLNNEAVLDKETGLVWARNANIMFDKTWADAVYLCKDLTIGNRKGWRLPMVEELASLMDPSQSTPALPSGYSSFFNNVVATNLYWSATTDESFPTYAMAVWMQNGDVGSDPKSSSNSVWPVRGGAGPILLPHTP